MMIETGVESVIVIGGQIGQTALTQQVEIVAGRETIAVAEKHLTDVFMYQTFLMTFVGKISKIYSELKLEK
jgi:hypothetical protein